MLPQVTDHVTAVFPAVVELENVAAADRVAEALTASEVGGAEIKTTAVGSGVAGGGGAEGLPDPPQPASTTSSASVLAHPATLVHSPVPG